MNPSTINDKRRLIPRWRNFNQASSTGELATNRFGTKTPVKSTNLYLSKLMGQWKKGKRSDIAADIVFYAVTSNNYKFAKEQAAYLLKIVKNLPIALSKISQEILDDDPKPAIVSNNIIHEFVDPKTAIWKEIARYKQLTSDWPRNAIFWTEKSRLYTVIGELDKAKIAIQIALNLAGTNRYVIRSAIRFFLHIDDSSGLNKLFFQQPNLYKNHWILAPYIALQDKLKNPTLKIKAVRSLIERVDDREITELTGSLASLELENGAIKASKKLFLKSAKMPNDNSLAQLTWAEEKTGFKFGTNSTHIPLSYEANTLKAIIGSDFLAAQHSTIGWLMDEPFSTVPAITGSTIAATFTDDLESAEQFCILGLRANPNDSKLLNNYAVVLAKIGKVEAAFKQFKKISLLDNSPLSITLNATAGLLLFRAGEIQEGRKKYQDAIDLAKRLNQPETESIAWLHFAMEEIKLGDLKPDKIQKIIDLNVTTRNVSEINFLKVKVSALLKSRGQIEAPLK